MKRSFWGLVWSNFLKIQGVLLGVIGIALWFFSPQTTISLGLFLLIVILCIVIILTFASTAYELFITSKQSFYLPKVIGSKKRTLTNQRIYLIFLLEPSELFSYDTIVSFYYLEDDFEQLIAIGRVRNIQQDSKIQVEVTDYVSGYEEIFNRLEKNDYTALEKTRVKPNIPKAYLDGTL
jgi:signal transduction histidine kinase